ncbi:16S rRNA (cytosine(1402)-N(4))-methyltransferase RsmH [Candidatus Gottesmanbacteria bacterium]|nr:16S rRNA (cytosine(1402)-N(4))-methyltransferase RsmH [Candidatus Gottesmanbacteria bacterium]
MERVSKDDQPDDLGYHTPVFLKEALEFLQIKPGKKYIDCTLGGGGHTEGILSRGGLVLGIDTDQEALEYIRKKFQISNDKFRITKGNFRDLKEIAAKNGFNKVDGILYDLGVSTHQLKSKGRGFSFGREEELDMRMDQDLEISAKEIINTYQKENLYEIFTKFGEEKRAWAIADATVRARQIEPILTTSKLVKLILGVRGKIGKNDRTHPATRVFQALRIYVNNELEALQRSLPQALDLLVKDGRLVVISFHSLEDRIVKIYFRKEEKKGRLKILTSKPIRPSEEEVEDNKASLSGKLRAAIKL